MLDVHAWEKRKPLTWDVTVMCPLADSYVVTAACVAVSAAEGTAACKTARYTDIGTNNMFQPIAGSS